MILLLAFLIGTCAGLRALSAPAVVAWAAHLGWLDIHGPLTIIGSAASVAILTVLAVGELIADKLPKTPNRTAPLGLVARIVTGGLSGACIAAANEAVPIIPALFGAAGGVAAAFAGYRIRKHLVTTFGMRDFVVALVEDVVAIAGSVFLIRCA